jgi:hypothetical protein
MRRLIMGIFLAAMLAVVGWAEDSKPAPTMPSEITLTSGRVLRKVEVVKWEKDRVVLKHSAGANTIAFSLIAEPHRSEILAYQEEMKKPASERRYAQTVKGQVYVTTRGSGAYKFSGVLVVAYSAENYNAIEAAAINNLPSSYRNRNADSRALHAAEAWSKITEGSKILALAKTDADGRFELKLNTTTPVFITCLATRLIAGNNEVNYWVKKADGRELILNESNQWDPWLP